jgi:hypothetical protein
MATQLSEIQKRIAANGAVTPFLRESPTQPLTCQDRCDCSALEGDGAGQVHVGSCGAQAQVRVTLRTGSQIVFCGHHYAQHGPKIAQVAVVYDERAEAEITFPPTRITTGEPTGLREVNY